MMEMTGAKVMGKTLTNLQPNRLRGFLHVKRAVSVDHTRNLRAVAMEIWPCSRVVHHPCEVSLTPLEDKVRVDNHSIVGVIDAHIR